ncbi:helix-turn-helix domain-containing protein [Hydrogenivirga sp. 128-5-R1-1]|uniref:helix-turn-helix transcriptional regulator n=1 Tax=Hydrogenivirga sp. 128-5-R1-1 TaxID=392423 RepID=UPI00015F18F1|nr:helix-turn-helix domain-containing protein [Hydrogenivirga sp. 128-5-R1-1]EDP75545.1 hypothetical protein HG1285_16311 [Hydrogenivirga sp. 128-5-R1-1]
MAEGERRLFTVKEALEYLRISRPTFYRLIKQGKIKPVKIGKRTLIDKNDLDRLIEESKEKS